MKGYIHSIQSLGAVDGPGVRSVVFMQGCALRCCYCHNPDTWQMWSEAQGVQELEAKELVDKLKRFHFYYGTEGGVTISGGEPLLQKEFVTEVFSELKKLGIHTALDTCGQFVDEGTKKLLEVTDLAMVDVKFLTEQEYETHAKGSFQKVQEFLALTEQMQVPLWVRHVVVPGITANSAYLRKVKEIVEKYRNLKKIEWLPFHNLCVEKYEKLNIPFPMKDCDAISDEELKKLLRGIE